MHSLNHNAYAHAVANDRIRAVPRGVARPRRHRPPPVRGHVAYAGDAESARRAVA